MRTGGYVVCAGTASILAKCEDDVQHMAALFFRLLLCALAADRKAQLTEFAIFMWT